MIIKYFIISIVLSLSAPVLADNGKGMTWGFQRLSFDGGFHQSYMESPPHGPLTLSARTSATNNFQKKIVKVGCYSQTEANQTNGVLACDAYHGDTSCLEKRPILCVKETPYKNRPPYAVLSSAHAMPKEFYAGWVGHTVKLTSPKKGTLLTSPAAADNLCGNGWKMADHHDGQWMSGMSPTNYFASTWNSAAQNGGWAFHAKYHNLNDYVKRVRLKSMRFWVKINNQPANCWNP